MEGQCFLNKASPQDSMTSQQRSQLRDTGWVSGTQPRQCCSESSSAPPQLQTSEFLTLLGSISDPQFPGNTSLLTFILDLCQSQRKHEYGHECLERGQHMRASRRGRAGSHILWLLGKSQSHSILLKSGPSSKCPEVWMLFWLTWVNKTVAHVQFHVSLEYLALVATTERQWERAPRGHDI